LYGTPVKCGGEKLYNEYPILSLTVYGSDPLEGIKENLESITCLAAEGPEVTPHAKLFEAILREALKALNILGR
jgi:2-iminoacetate synthase ThiH